MKYMRQHEEKNKKNKKQREMSIFWVIVFFSFHMEIGDGVKPKAKLRYFVIKSMAQKWLLRQN